MSIKITKDGVTFEVETKDELKAVLDAIGEPKRRGVSLNPKDFITNIDTLVGVYENIPTSSKARRVLHLLKENSNGMTVDELVAKLGLDSEHALGGVLGNIGKYARQFGVDTKDIYKWTEIEDRWVYGLTKNMAEAIETSGKREGE